MPTKDIIITRQKTADTENKGDSPLNIFLKNLPLADKKEFLEEVLGTKIIFDGTDKDKNRKRFDNWRYLKNANAPSEVTMVLLFIIARKYQAEITIYDLFPAIPSIYAELMIPMFMEYYYKTQSIKFTHKSLHHAKQQFKFITSGAESNIALATQQT